MEDAVLQLRESVIGHQWGEVRHRNGTVQPVQVHFTELEKLEEQLAEIFRTIGPYFETDRIAPARTPQFLLDAAQEVIGFLLVNIEIAVPGDAERVRAIEEQAGEKVGDVMFDERREIDVIPRFVFALAARQQNQARQDARDLDNGMEGLAATFAPGADEQIVALVQELGEGMTGIHCERRQQREDFLAKIALGPGGSLCIQVGHVVHPNAILRQGGGKIVVPKRIFGRDHFVRDPLDGIENLSRAQAVGADVAGLALDLLLNAGDPNLEKLVQVRTENRQKFDAFDEGLRRVLCFFQDAPVEFEPA